MWISKSAGQLGRSPKCPICDCEIKGGPLSGHWPLQKFGDESCDRRALAPGEGDVGEEWMALQSFNDSDYTIMATDPQVISLGNIVGHDDS